MEGAAVDGTGIKLEFEDSQVAESDKTVLLKDFDACVWGTDAREAWKLLRAAGPLVEPREGILVVCSTAAVEEVLRQPNLFSSNPEAAYFGSETGAIPLQIDPPGTRPTARSSTRSSPPRGWRNASRRSPAWSTS